MIKINDPYDLVPELFIAYPEFVKSTDADVDVISIYSDESLKNTSRPTIFIQPEPYIHSDNKVFPQQIAARPNAMWALSNCTQPQQASSSNWFLYFANLIMTVRVNPSLLSLELGAKPWLATAMIGGWSAQRGHLLNQLRKRNLLDKCLVNYQERTPDPVEQRNSNRISTPEIFFNMRTPALNELDLSVFQDIAFSKNTTDTQYLGMNTCRPIPGSRSGQHAWISQLIPWKIYNSAYISIVTETEILSDLFFISEKITRPMLVGHPFVILGCAGYLDKLRKLGFQTFSPWLDESYDLISKVDQRILAIANSVEKFSKLTEVEKQHACIEMHKATEHNKLLIKNQQWTQLPLRDAILNFKEA